MTATDRRLQTGEIKQQPDKGSGSLGTGCRAVCSAGLVPLATAWNKNVWVRLRRVAKLAMMVEIRLSGMMRLVGTSKASSR